MQTIFIFDLPPHKEGHQKWKWACIIVFFCFWAVANQEENHQQITPSIQDKLPTRQGVLSQGLIQNPGSTTPCVELCGYHHGPHDSSCFNMFCNFEFHGISRNFTPRSSYLHPLTEFHEISHLIFSGS